MNPVLNILKALLGFWKFKLWSKLHIREKATQHYVYLNLDQEELLDRYLLNFLQQLNSGHPTIIVIPFRINFIRRFFEGRNWRHYQTLLIQSEKLHFAFLTAQRQWKNVSWDYFDSNLKTSRQMRIPIGPHPIHFENFKNVRPEQHRSGVFFAGAHSESYAQFFSEETWQMPNRMASIQFLNQNGFGDVISVRMPHEEYCERLKSHRFFLALPGMHMPLCHNVFEALFSGCIPIIHLQYLQLLPKTMQEELKPYSWDTHNELLQLLSRLTNENQSLVQEEKTRMACATFANSYFRNPNLHDLVAKAETIIICGEEHSVRSHESAMR
jgi:hypothetical protein